MTEQELRDEFEHEAWCDTQNNISKVCNCMMGYPLEIIENLKETIAELESRLEQSVDISVVDELNETIKAKDAEIKLQSEYIDKLYTVSNEQLSIRDKTIAEARLFLHDLYWLNRHDREAIKTWLESKK